jgi:hypothetical protein
MSPSRRQGLRATCAAGRLVPANAEHSMGERADRDADVCEAAARRPDIDFI